MHKGAVIDHIVSWLDDYCEQSPLEGFVVGISGGIDSALTSTLCAKTGRKVVCLSMPIYQHSDELSRAVEHINWLKANFENVSSYEVDLTSTFDEIKDALPPGVTAHDLSMANTRSRLRMSTLYAVGQSNRLLVAGTGNKVEDFGVGFFTKYGDGGVDMSPIADLVKSEVFELAAELGVVESILTAPPTDGLWNDDRTDEDQIGATYDELEWAMDFSGDENSLSDRQREVLTIYRRFHNANLHKMVPIPVCKIPAELK